MNTSRVVESTINLTKRTGHGVANIAGKAKDYAVGVGSLVVRDVKKVPGMVKRLPSNISKAVRSKIEINIIMPANKPESPTQDQDHTTIES